MNEPSFLGLIHNAALLLGIVLLFDLVLGNRRIGKSKIWQIIVGIIPGLVGIILMMTPWVLIPGIIFDTRSVLLSITGLFLGPIPTVISIIMMAAFRIYQGGSAVWMGVCVIIEAGFAGILWQRMLHKPLDMVNGRDLYLFGLVIHILMLACAFVLPLETAIQVITNISIPVMLIYPVATLLLGLMMVHRLRREQIADNLARGEARLRSLVEILQHPVESIQEFLDFSLDQAIQLTESKIGYIYLYSEEYKQFKLSSISQSAMAECKLTNYATCYELTETGLWGEAIRQRKPIIMNNYPAENPLKKGYPHGHVQILSYMTIPVFRGGHIVAVIGVANKENNYNEGDVLQLTLLMDGVWKAIERKKAEEWLRESEERYKAIINNLPNGLIHILDPDFRYVFNAGKGMDTLGLRNEDLVGKSIYDVLGSSSGDIMAAYYQQVLNGQTVKFEGNYEGHDFIIHASPLRNSAGEVAQILALSIEISDRKIAEEKLKSTQKELRKMFEESDQSRCALLSVVEDQKIAEEKVRRLNSELEQRVIDRTAQLEAANKELEAFAYSVSHDLRTPLRSINGFSEILITDYQSSLDEKGQNYLQRIHEASRRMGQLIEDLLHLSRITRCEMNRDQVNLSLMAQQIADELKNQDPNRKIDFEIAPHLTVQADPNLLRIALDNLINNAYKFSNQRELSHIEIGVVEESHKQVFYVRDNGSGFDMAYVDKLFLPFQRLHSFQEFPGTGIGLVTVQRIITRHGGRIWSEAAVGQGATFYFTLGEMTTNI